MSGSNYLEQLAAEWYSFAGYFVRTNVRARRYRELDVLAYKPKDRELVHIELSSVSIGREQIREKFNFELAEYERILGVKIDSLKRIFVTYHPGSRSRENDIKVKSVSEFFQELISDFSKRVPGKQIVPDGFPILRTIQMVVWELKPKRRR